MIRHSSAKQPRPSHRVARWVGRNWARLNYGRTIEPTWLEVNRFDVTIADLPSAFDGFRVLQLTDMHAGKHIPAGYLADVVGQAKSESADLVVVTGDFVHKGFSHVEMAAESLRGLSAAHGVYAVLGNHDHSIRNALGLRRHRSLSATVTAALAARGVRVLENESAVLRRGDDVLHLAGVDDLWSRRCDVTRALDGLGDNQPRLMLAHNPHTVERLNGLRCDLMLSGHTHGGQIDWPGLGRVTLSKKARRYAAGLYQLGATQLYVNKGVGYGVRFRYGVRPELAVFQLRRHS